MADRGLSSPPDLQHANTNRREASAARNTLAKYYFTKLTDSNPVDPAAFLDRVFTDYAKYESDVVGDWLKNLSPLYQLYRTYVKYAIDHGSRDVQTMGEKYQGVGNGDLMLLKLDQYSQVSKCAGSSKFPSP